MTYYHYCCAHSAAGIDATGKVLPGFMLTEREVPFTARVAWFTDLAVPDRFALGLTSFALACDRTEVRYRVTDPTEVMPWHVYARSIPRERREVIENAPGSRPAHWFVAVCGVLVVRDVLERAP